MDNLDAKIHAAFMSISRQAYEEAKLSGTGWVKFSRVENGEFEVVSVPAKNVSQKEPKS